MSVKRSQYPRPVVKRPLTVVTRETSTNVVISDALSIISDQIQILKVKSAFGASLEADEVKNLRSYVQSLTELRRDERDQEKHDKVSEELGDLTNDELIKLLQDNKEPLAIEDKKSETAE